MFINKNNDVVSWFFKDNQQQKLQQATVLIIGLGGLGSPVALYLARAGIGQLVLVDFDKVDLSNLQRQIIHNTQQISKEKVISAQDTLHAINPNITITPISEKLDKNALIEQMAQVDVVVDCSDNFATRFIINEASVKTKTPLVSGAALRFQGQISVFLPQRPNSPCYHCLYPEVNMEETTCSQNGVIAPLVGIIGSLQASEVIKVLLDIDTTLCGKLMLFNAYNMQWKTLQLAKDPACLICQTNS